MTDTGTPVGEPLFTRGRTSGPESGGADLGHWGQVGGTLPGSHMLAAAAADVGPAVVALQQRREQQKAAKDYNDAPAASTVGADGGNVVKDMAIGDT